MYCEKCRQNLCGKLYYILTEENSGWSRLCDVCWRKLAKFLRAHYRKTKRRAPGAGDRICMVFGGMSQ